MKLSRILAVAAICAVAHDVFAAGIYLAPRGVRPLSRGGAFVAGADDVDSMWYNPAGLMDAGNQFAFDLAVIPSTSTFQRRSYVPAGSTGEPVIKEDYPRVDGAAPFLPIPGVGGTYNFGLDTWNFGVGLSVPYAALINYPETVIDPNQNNQQVPAPQRYSVITPQGTVLGKLGVFAAKSFLDKKLYIGLGPTLTLGTFSTTAALSSCDGIACSQSQDPDYDSYTRVSTFLVSPSLSLGAIYKIDTIWRVGLSMDLPTWVDMPATIETRLPRAPMFAGASVDGTAGRMKLRLPFVGRIGVEARPLQNLRVEFAAVFEGWSIHDKIEILRPSASRGVNLVNVTGLPSPYPIGDLAIDRHFRDTFSLRLGAEYLGGNVQDISYRLRAGFVYERSAVPTEYISVLSLYPDTVTPTLGASIGFNGFRIDLTYAAVIGIPVTVDPATAKLYPTNPVLPQTPIAQVAINGGSYWNTSHVIGLGLAYQFDRPANNPAPAAK